jgi:hypothetical protein
LTSHRALCAVRKLLRALRSIALLFTAVGYGTEQLRLLAGVSSRTTSVGCRETRTADRELGLGDDFLYDAVVRMNEAVVGNIDTVDLALLAVVGGALAVLVFSIDKVRELAPPFGTFSYWLLGASVAACIVGYLTPGSPREPIDPMSFTVAFTEQPDDATSVAIKDAVYAFNANVRIRFVKRISVATALVSLVAGTAVVALARSAGLVV